MFNQATFNLRTFNFGIPSTTSFSGRLEYNGYAMGTSSTLAFRITDIQGINDSGYIMKQTYDKVRSHGQGLSNYLYKSKSIMVRGIISGDTKSQLQAEIDSMITAISQHNQTLKFLRDDGVILEATAYVERFRYDDFSYRTTFREVEIQFIIIDPFMYSTTVQQTAFEGKTATFSSSVAYIEGTYEARPTITLNFQTGISGVSSVQVDLAGYTITVNETITDSDSLVIDCKEQDVKINDVGGKDYTGVFPVMTKGNHDFDVTIAGTRTADIYVQRQNTYV